MNSTASNMKLNFPEIFPKLENNSKFTYKNNYSQNRLQTNIKSSKRIINTSNTKRLYTDEHSSSKIKTTSSSIMSKSKINNKNFKLDFNNKVNDSTKANKQGNYSKNNRTNYNNKVFNFQDTITSNPLESQRTINENEYYKNDVEHNENETYYNKEQRTKTENANNLNSHKSNSSYGYGKLIEKDFSANKLKFNQGSFNKILHELELLDVNSLLKVIDPSFDSKDLLNEISNYDKAIRNEITVITHQIKRENNYLDTKKKFERKILKIKTPHLPNYLTTTPNMSYNVNNLSTNNNSNDNDKSAVKLKGNKNLRSSGSLYMQPQLGTTKIDFKIFTQSLEKDIVIISQKINDQKYYNVLLSKEVEELRKNLINCELKCSDLANEFFNLETEFFNMKEIHVRTTEERKSKLNKYLNFILFI